MSTRKKSTTPTPKITCNGDCGKTKAESRFYKVDSPLFPTGRINTCSDCVRASINIEKVEQVISFLRQIDKPFYQEEWEKAKKHPKNHPLGVYIGTLGLSQYKGKTFNDSDGIDGVGKVNLESVKAPDKLETVTGKTIEYTDDLVTTWGIGYTKLEYLQMQKYSEDMKATHEIHTPTHIDLVTQLAYLSVDRNRLRQAGDWGNYSKVSKSYDDMLKTAGFRPVDRQGTDDATGMRSFSQIFEEVEKKGFRKPPALEFEDDIVDAMIISLANYYNRLVGKQILDAIPDEIKEEMDSFFIDDLTPEEDISDDEYEALDFSVNDDE